MAQGVPNSALTDLLRTTLTNLPDMEFQVALKYQDYNVVNHWFEKEKVQEESGTSIERNIELDPKGNAKHVRLYQKTAINVTDQHTKISAPWVQVQSDWSIERREALRNRKPARYISLVRTRRVAAAVDLANLLEERAWKAPESASDDLNPQGIVYWLSKVDTLASDVVGDFVGKTVRYNGGTTSTEKGGIDGAPATNAMWRNYAGTYRKASADGIIGDSESGANPNQFIKRMRLAFHKTRFKSPLLARQMMFGPTSRFKLYCNANTITDIEELSSIKNENIGRDLDPFHGITTFRRVPILYEPQLDADLTNPVYGVNHSRFYPIVMEDDWMRESEPLTDVEQQNVTTVYLEGSYQYFSDNVREAGFVLSQDQTA